MIPVQVVGLGCGPESLAPRQARIIAEAQVLAGGRRLLAMFPGHGARQLTLVFNLEAWLGDIAQAARDQRVVVLASGDPGFYGIAGRLVERLGKDAVVIHPNLTTVQSAFALLKEPWQDVAVVSLHGRDYSELWPALSRSERVAVYTDPDHSPGRIAEMLLERGQVFWRMAVLEDLGAGSERVGEYSLAESAGMSFSPLNLVVLKRQAWPEMLRLGMTEDAFEHQGGLITKTEVRALALAKLELSPGLTLWDLGAGSGSLSLEASLLTQGGTVVAVERSPDRVAQIISNRRRFGAASLEIVQARLPEAMAELPDPDRIFVGGGGPEIEAIIAGAAKRLRPSGILVAAVVLLSSLDSARRTMASFGLTQEITQIQISRGAALGEDSYLKAQNPVWLVKGIKSQ